MTVRELAERIRPWFPWILATSVLLVVAVTCWPVLAHPQLEPDDYRYLYLLEEGAQGGSFFERTLVENRWDHLWWIQERDPVRFWRPTVLLSYGIDLAIWGRSDIAFGLCLSNVLLYAGCCLLVGAIFTRLFGRRIETYLATLLFTAFFAHGEVIWYVAGRTDTIAVLFFLIAWRLHLAGGKARYAGAVAFFVAILTKELTIALPLLLLLGRPWFAGEKLSIVTEAKSSWRWLTAYGGAVLLWFVLRAIALGGRASGGASEPYFVSPLGGDFPAHLWVQLRAYASNLLAARSTEPFLTYEGLERFQHAFATSVIAWGLALGALVYLLHLCRDRRATWLVGFVVLTWLPTSFVYVSERYLLLPSIGVAGLALCLMQQLGGRGQAASPARAPAWPGYVAMFLVLVWTGHQSVQLRQKHEYLMGAPRRAAAFDELLARDAPGLAKGAKLFLVNFPGEVLDAQFFEMQMRAFYSDPTLSVRILSHCLDGGTPGNTPRIRVPEARTIELDAPRVLTWTPPERRIFPFVEMRAGTRVDHERLGFTVEVLEGDGAFASRARYRLDEPVGSYEVWTYLPGRVGHALRRGDYLRNVQSGRILLGGRLVRERLESR